MSSKKIENPRPPQRLGLILGLLVTAQFVVILDFSIVQIALPTIRGDLHMSLADLTWIVSAYGLTFAGFLMLSGRASDIYGRKRFFMLGLVIFSVASLAGGLATSELVLIAARVVQGIGAALASATALALIVRIFAPLGRLNQALGIFTAVSSAGFSAGVILGGVLTEALGWRWIFFVNVPIGILASLLAVKFLPDAGGPRKAGGHLDIPGAATVTGGLMLLVYGLTEIGNGDTSYGTYLVLALAAAVLASFLVIEYRSAAPLMPLNFLGRRTIFFANATALLTFAANVSMIFLLTTYLQALLSYPPLTAAAALLPGALVYFFLGGFGAPRLVKRFGARSVLVGAMVALSAGLLLFTRISLDSSYLTIVLPALLVACVGGSLALTASNIAALAGAKPGEEGIASGLINTSRQVGGPVGLAVAVSVIGLVTQGLGISAPSGEVITAFRYAFVVGASFGAFAVVTSLLIKGASGQTEPTRPPAQQPAAP
ncbi:MAG: MFS transporter [Thaumarchaeota archaeon]|nr:MFS transporter [Nitrososphaerota archaeon]